MTASHLRPVAEPFRVYGIAIMLLFLLVAIIPKGNEVLAINGLHNHFLDFFFVNVTNLGEGVVFVPLVLVTLFLRFEYTLTTVLSAGFLAAIVSLFKRVLFYGVLRPRRVLSQELLYYVPGVEVHGINSFPSGHTATVFTIALLTALFFRNRLVTILSLAIALLVGCSRMYLLQHFMLDVASGAAMGFLSVFLAWRIFKLFTTPRWMTRKLSLPKAS